MEEDLHLMNGIVSDTAVCRTALALSALLDIARNVTKRWQKVGGAKRLQKGV